jgi:AbrB family looped-hinge helix DNA binding protein
METTTAVEVTRVSSKGQIVLPKDVRTKLHLKKGTMFAMQATKNVILLKKIDNPILKADLETLQKVEEAWDDITHGKFHKASKEDFLKELATW